VTTDLPNGMRGHYQLAGSTMTLGEGLAEYYRVNPGLSEPAKITAAKSAAYFHNHDSTHVIFGTHTGPLHEGANDLWTLFGVDISFKDYAGGFFATDESKQIAQEFDYKTLGPLLWGSLKLVPEIRRRCKAMSKKWPWTPPDDFLSRPLDELRAEFGIEVFVPEEHLGISP
jgi:hypothetical protein